MYEHVLCKDYDEIKHLIYIPTYICTRCYIHTYTVPEAYSRW